MRCSCLLEYRYYALTTRLHDNGIRGVMEWINLHHQEMLVGLWTANRVSEDQTDEVKFKDMYVCYCS